MFYSINFGFFVYWLIFTLISAKKKELPFYTNSYYRIFNINYGRVVDLLSRCTHKCHALHSTSQQMHNKIPTAIVSTIPTTFYYNIPPIHLTICSYACTLLHTQIIYYFRDKMAYGAWRMYGG